MKITDQSGNSDLSFKTLQQHHHSEIDMNALSLCPCDVIEMLNTTADKALKPDMSKPLKDLFVEAIVSGKETFILNVEGSSSKVDFYVIRTTAFRAAVQMSKAIIPEEYFSKIKEHPLNNITPIRATRGSYND